MRVCPSRKPIWTIFAKKQWSYVRFRMYDIKPGMGIPDDWGSARPLGFPWRICRPGCNHFSLCNFCRKDADFTLKQNDGNSLVMVFEVTILPQLRAAV